MVHAQHERRWRSRHAEGPEPRGNVQEIRDASRIAADVDLRVAGLEIGSLSLAPVRTPPPMK